MTYKAVPEDKVAWAATAIVMALFFVAGSIGDQLRQIIEILKKDSKS